MKKKKIKDLFRLIPFLFILYIYTGFFLFPSNISAERGQMDSPGYVIQMPNVNMSSGSMSKSGKTITQTSGQTAPGEYDKDGYIVKSGFQYIYTAIEEFSFSISNLNLAYGSLVPETPETQTTTLSVNAPSVGGYQVTAYESHPLRNENGEEIDDTTCDNNDCDEIDSGEWDDSNIDGFGYRMSGDDIADGFTQANYYKQFANIEDPAESPEEVMGANVISLEREATVHAKLNILGTQESGKYKTELVFICTPEY